MLECKRCGAMLAPTDKFCTNCGTPTGLGENVAAQEAIEPEQETVQPAQEVLEPEQETVQSAQEILEPEQEMKKEKSSIDWPDSTDSHAKEETPPKHEAETDAAVSGGHKTQKVLIPEAYKPLGMWSYFGYEVLFAIPCIGIIFLLIYALGGTENINLKNFARSHFCFSILMCILCVLAVALIFIFGGNTVF